MAHEATHPKPRPPALDTALVPTPATPTQSSSAPRPSSPSGEPRPEPHSPGKPSSPHVYHLPNTHKSIRIDPLSPDHDRWGATDIARGGDERQPLLRKAGARELEAAEAGGHGLAKRRIMYPLVLLLLLAMLAGIIISIGGWELNRRKHDKGK